MIYEIVAGYLISVIIFSGIMYIYYSAKETWGGDNEEENKLNKNDRK